MVFLFLSLEGSLWAASGDTLEGIRSFTRVRRVAGAARPTLLRDGVPSLPTPGGPLVLRRAAVMH